MKNKYIKPTLIIERFTLTQSIAGSCEGVAGGSAFSNFGPMHWSKTSCAWNDGGMAIFITQAVCADIQLEAPDSSFTSMDGYHNYCYDNPDGGLSVFGS